MADVVIRKVKSEDAEQVVKLLHYVWRVAYEHIFPEEVFVDIERKGEDKIKNFDSIYYNDDETLSYVAEDNGKIVGFVLAKMKSDYPHFLELGYADLQALYIHPDYQGQKISSKLKNIFVDWAKQNGANKFVIGVLKDNQKARLVYENWGGKLDDFESPFVKLNKGYAEVFYTYEIK